MLFRHGTEAHTEDLMMHLCATLGSVICAVINVELPRYFKFELLGLFQQRKSSL